MKQDLIVFICVACFLLIAGFCIGFIGGLTYTTNLIIDSGTKFLDKINANITIEIDEEALVNYTYDKVISHENKGQGTPRD